VPDDRWAAGPHYAAGLARAVPADKLAPAVQAAAGPAMSPAGGVEAAPSWNVAFWSGLGLALLAGLMLNIMPCVLPVIPLKVLGLVQQAGESRRRFVTLGLAFAAGIVLFFAGIAVVNAVLKLLFASTFRWGEHYQSPVFVIGMVVLLVAMALSMFGAFTVMAPAWLTRRFGGGHGHGHASAVGMGMFTAVLSTPCSFALLATALGWAQAQPLAVGSLAFVVIGIGMAAPYAVLTAFPGLLRHLPRPGRWMELFKQTVGFVMLLVAVWLARGLFTNGYPFWVMGWVIVVAACIWAWMKWVHPAAPLGRRLLVRGPLAVVVFAAGLWMLPPQGPQAVDFEPFDEARIVAMRQAGSPVLIDFTASWCVTCQYVGEKIYNDPAVAKELRRRGVVAMVGDVTREDVPADRFRRQLGEAIPVTVILPPGGGEPIMLRGVFSKDDLWRALDQAQPPRP
jgi:thiol:disulfide interchange protein